MDNDLKPFKDFLFSARITQCRNVDCKFHEFKNIACRLKEVHIDKEGKCSFYERKKSR